MAESERSSPKLAEARRDFFLLDHREESSCSGAQCDKIYIYLEENVVEKFISFNRI